MKSWLLERGGRESLHLIDISEPKPGPEQILVRTKAVSLNYRDKLMIVDKYLHPVVYPLVPGSDLAGEVVAVGSGVSRFKAGDQVVSMFRPKWLRGVPSSGRHAKPWVVHFRACLPNMPCSLNKARSHPQ